MAGLLAAGAYVPRTRLQRSAIADAHEWFAPGLTNLARGERAVSSWDEDAITMAVEAARDCLASSDRTRVRKLILASTSHPYADRQNAAVAKEALNLSDGVATADFAGSQRAGVSALLSALESANGGAGPVLCIAADKRRTLPASEQEMTAGDAAAALLVGDEAGAAELICSHSETIDFVDHHRADGHAFDYAWESRWVREEGYGRIVPRAVRQALAKAHLTPDAITRFIMAAPVSGANLSVARTCGISSDRVTDALADKLGDSGTAHPLVMLTHALETARAGDVLVLVGFGQGCDVLIFRATGTAACCGLGVSGWLDRRCAERRYTRYLTHAGHLQIDMGMRSELDQKTALSALYRNRRAVMALVGGKCPKTGAVQFPKSAIAVIEQERLQIEQDDYPLADRIARIVTYTADNLTSTPDPPCWYGAIEFEEGGRMTVEFTDLDPAEIQVGARMRMMFRIRARDTQRGFTKYFWKAVPDYRAVETASHATG